MKRQHYICTSPNCGKPHVAKGFCSGHYHRFVKGQDVTTPLKVFDHVFKNSHGYTVLYLNGKEVLEHRYVVEKHLGRKLKKCELVHHKNKNRSDNRISNLQVIKRGKHISLHHYNVPKPKKQDYNKPINTREDWYNRGKSIKHSQPPLW